MSKTKTEHYVAKSYLKKFASDGKLFVFDKRSGKEFHPNVVNVASENYFYDIDPSFLTVSEDSQLVEKYFIQVDGDFVRVRDEMLRTINAKKKISIAEKRKMWFFITIQLFRTRGFRDFLVKFVGKQVKASRGIEFPGEGMESLEQAKFMFDPELLTRSYLALTNHIWIIGINRTKQPLYTSDTPVVGRPHQSRLAGPDFEGVEICFPLTPKCVLILLERNHFSHLKRLDGKVRPLNVEQVRYSNHMQVVYSNRQIYSLTEDFSHAKELLDKHPELSDPDRPNYLRSMYQAGLWPSLS